MLRAGGGHERLQKTKYAAVRYTRGKGLDIGQGPWKAFQHFIGIRRKDDKDIPPTVAPDFAVDTFDNLSSVVAGQGLDFAYIWVDVENEEHLFNECGKLLKVGGYLIKANADFTIAVWQKTADAKMDLVDTRVSKWGEKTCCIIRYGAIGDMLQVASLFPELKRQGYHVTVNCHPDGHDILQHDKNVDQFWVQDRDQVPNMDLVDYWKWLVPQFDKVVNLCESVEGALLTYPGHANHRWPDAVRRKYCNLNYLEFMSELAELPFHPEHHFYPSPDEEKFADDFVDRIRREVNKDVPPMGISREPYMVLWALAGSSVHKFWPHQDAIVARMLLEIPHLHLIFVGDEACKILEGGWENESRISCMSGMLPIRKSIALAQKCNLVIGPETGMLNAVAFETMAKVLLLSHSTENNLSRDWVNCDSLHSTVTPCYPCHRMHLNHDFCPQDKNSGAAMCQADLPASVVWDAIQRAYVGWGTVKNLLSPHGKIQAPSSGILTLGDA